VPSPLSRLHADRNNARAAIDQLPGPLQAFAHRADLGDEHIRAFALWIVAIPVATSLSWIAAGRSIAACVALAGVGIPVALAMRWSGRRARRLVAALPDAVDAIGRSLRSGSTLRHALAEAADDTPPVVASELRSVLSAVDKGAPFVGTLGSWARREPRAEVRIVAAALALASENESGTTQALEGVSQTLRDRHALRGEIQGLTAQAATSMQALVLLPVAFLVIDALGDGGALRYLTTTPIGRLCLVSGVGLDVAGWTWMRAVIRRQLPT